MPDIVSTEVPTTQNIYIMFVNDFEVMKAYPMNEDNCKENVICSLRHCSHVPM